jgi:plasmid stabilization system protein ParE
MGRQHQLAYRRALLERLERIAARPHGYRERPELGTGVRLMHYRGL